MLLLKHQLLSINNGRYTIMLDVPWSIGLKQVETHRGMLYEGQILPCLLPVTLRYIHKRLVRTSSLQVNKRV